MLRKAGAKIGESDILNARHDGLLMNAARGMAHMARNSIGSEAGVGSVIRGLCCVVGLHCLPNVLHPKPILICRRNCT